MNDLKSKIFKAIADPTRREIFHLLVVGSALSISGLSDQFEISRQGVTKHLKILEEAQLVSIKHEGREKLIFAKPNSLKAVKDWLAYYDQFWDEKLLSLKQHLDQS